MPTKELHTADLPSQFTQLLIGEVDPFPALQFIDVMLLCITFLSVTFLMFLPRTDSACPTDKPTAGTDQPSNSTSLPVVVVSEVKRPGVSFKPSTGKKLRIFQLDSTLLHGTFVSHDNRVLNFKSTCSGVVHVWRQDGSTLIEHEYVSQTKGIHFVRIEQTAFVYGSTRRNGTYRMPTHRSRRDAEEEYDDRARQGHSSDDEEVDRAFGELASDRDSRLLSRLSQALGEFGIYGSLSPCSLPLHLTAMSITKNLAINASQDDDDVADLEQFHCAEQMRGDDFPVNAHRRTRVRRGWFRRYVVGTIKTVVTRVIDPVLGLFRHCSSKPNRHDKCLGMCGPECKCWSWVCGNCCYNTGCYQHDVCCRSGGKVSCYIPTGFSCSSYWEYPECL